MQGFQTRKGLGYNPLSFLLLLSGVKQMWLYIPDKRDTCTAFASVCVCVSLLGFTVFLRLTAALYDQIIAGVLVAVGIWFLTILRFWPRKAIKFAISDLVYASFRPKLRFLTLLFEWASFWLLLLSSFEILTSNFDHLLIQFVKALMLILLLSPLAGLSHQMLVIKKT